MVLQTSQNSDESQQNFNKYDSLLSVGDLNINIVRPPSDSFNHLSHLNDTFSLTNLVTNSTCFKPIKTL